ncbi:phosphoribosylformylglycinamidine synthase subunit PurL [Candidatus Nitrosocosmicus arcticus]|uniref:Phosphoribosylformylglycinamidine synthase subunit PurL n=1 Tax=Candidatus Nitrosocosmicus arcticus TaxID=2035267 RepID=A0A557SYC9_9ARCH|nr:phosphoribosylformylglycinamidine synthase subunit PurL [Candidatus Nitrosocosmicus arcticus]TVP41614.1 Phosphoribosylformylglycinamidine synthase 2 [Candidatus Nitrosocosmicus arcticus]
MNILNIDEYSYLRKKLRREPNELEQFIISAEWSEHCSYKSSKKHLKLLPMKGNHVLVGPGYDAGVIDVGNGYVVTIHIESHNHPSAVEPYGGAATGVGGVLRDILSMGSRPIALFNALRFGQVDRNSKFGSKNRWLLKNVVKGIADYGNCIGVPTVGGEVEFDKSFDNYCLVDVASIGYAKLENLVLNRAKKGDPLILGGNATGLDGIHGASFASKNLEEENRSAVQIPDPFLEKMLMEATLEAIENDCIKTMKDLGGGGLSCCLSETADSLKKGFLIDLSTIPLKQTNMTDAQIMISESQERMLYIVNEKKKLEFFKIFDKYNVNYSEIGYVTDDLNLSVVRGGNTLACMPANIIAHAPLLNRKFKQPPYLEMIVKSFREPEPEMDIKKLVFKMLSNPSICSRKWIYEQFDHEVGVRTVSKPGESDSSVIKLDGNKFLSFKLDGNAKHCYLNPYEGIIGCLAESLRNLTCVGASPLGIVDHLQFGNPENEEIFWTFLQTINGIRDYCKFMNIPVVGGKVSLYNETNSGPIKPSPVIGMLGLIDSKNKIKYPKYTSNQSIFVVGTTKNEMGGSEYFEYCLNILGGKVPHVDLDEQRNVVDSIKNLIDGNLITGVHDCSKGGMIVSVLEMALHSNIGFKVSVDKMPNKCSRLDYLLFSESHNRFIFSTSHDSKIIKYLKKRKIPYARIGSSSNDRTCLIDYKGKVIFKSSLETISQSYHNSFSNLFTKSN